MLSKSECKQAKDERLNKKYAEIETLRNKDITGIHKKINSRTEKVFFDRMHKVYKENTYYKNGTNTSESALMIKDERNLQYMETSIVLKLSKIGTRQDERKQGSRSRWDCNRDSANFRCFQDR